MIVDILFHAYTSRYVALGNTEIRKHPGVLGNNWTKYNYNVLCLHRFFKVWIGMYHWNGDWFVCLPHPKHKSAIRIPRMKRLTGTHHYTALVLLALLQGSLFARKPSLRCFRMLSYLGSDDVLYDESRLSSHSGQEMMSVRFYCDMFYLLSM